LQPAFTPGHAGFQRDLHFLSTLWQNNPMDAKKLLLVILDDISKAGFSVAEVCKGAGIDPSLVSRWKSGKVEPRLSSLTKLEASLALLDAQKAPR
jgi:hypothetical protein